MKKKPIEELILRASKEIVVKFIEVGRVSPTSFSEAFPNIYRTIAATVSNNQSNDEDDKE